MVDTCNSMGFTASTVPMDPPGDSEADAKKVTGEISGKADKLPTKAQAEAAVAATLGIDKSKVKATVTEARRRLSSDDGERRLASVSFKIAYEVLVTLMSEENVSALTTKLQKIGTGSDAIQNTFAAELAKGGVTVEKASLTASEPKKVEISASSDDPSVSGSPPRFQMAAFIGISLSAALLAV